MRLLPSLLLNRIGFLNSIDDRELNLQSLRINMIENLAVLEDQFDIIDFSHNQIRKMENFPKMLRLSILYFTNNGMSKIDSALSLQIPNIQTLELSDNDFETFYDICDNLVQPIIEATASTDCIGRAWFHPKYDADQVGHDTVIAGHAVPHKMVRQFIETINGPESMKNISANDLTSANNKVRMTPHATINILRRSQLNAAARYEKSLGDKRPKPNSIYVRNALKLIDVLKGSNHSRSS